ncbi:hypothetical protein SK128_006353 [Halocaridina rubra]|uniref:Uncharacterized protein n=1 Tax=Halocaridina rubra TaxID=373956 RepID=A0AAN8ZVU3_HALRR
MSGKLSFEQLCAGGTGYACDERSMVKLSETESFDDIKFKLVTKCETNLLFLRSPSATVSHFTLDVVPIYNKSSLASAWRSCEQKGFDGLHAIAHLDQSNIPKNGCSTKYTFLQFVDSVIRAIEHHFMFQRYNPGFAMNALNLWNLPTDKDLQSCLIVYAWKFDRLPEEELLSRSLLSQKNSSSVDHMENLENSGEEERCKSLPIHGISG